MPIARRSNSSAPTASEREAEKGVEGGGAAASGWGMGGGGREEIFTGLRAGLMQALLGVGDPTRLLTLSRE